MEIGIVGLPNVGKSTLFNALTAGHAASSNYPFTTIEPNVGVVLVPDDRLGRLSEIFKPKKTTPAAVNFVDIAGLVKGASQGEGLGNKFLANIREVDAIIHVVRLFKDEDVVHTLGEVDPVRDIEVIETELILADLASADKQIDKLEGKARSGDKEAIKSLDRLKKVKETLNGGGLARAAGYREDELKEFFLLTSKPVLYVGNTDEKPDPAVLADFAKVAEARGAKSVALCGKIEAEILQLPEEERGMFLEDLGVEKTGLERVIVAAYDLLGLQSYFTGGPDEVRAWTIVRGMTAPQAAGVIHTDFEKGFIRADVYAYADLVALGSESALREKGKIRSEGKEYVVKDGDVCFFKFNN
ncbi:MAG: redox-regulated ATPase YchF [Elusimicrobia bacterium CG_4_9_14_3_um_filter_62_55]|nr:MAG: redox-regulated ATPase YchF [Elusimicrobia bacterium CG_4_9_14_3_um_filter_62_55]